MVYQRSLQLAFAASLCLLIAGTPTRADLVTDAAGIPGSQKVVDFSQFSGGYNYFADFHSAPVQIGRSIGENILWSATDPTSFLGDNTFFPYDLSPNGFWDDGRVGFSALDVASGTMTYTFRNPVSAVGGFINYSPDPTTTVTLAALDSSGNILESYEITSLAPISTPGEMDAGAFRGIALSSAVIAAFSSVGLLRRSGRPDFQPCHCRAGTIRADSVRRIGIVRGCPVTTPQAGRENFSPSPSRRIAPCGGKSGVNRETGKAASNSVRGRFCGEMGCPGIEPGTG